MCVSFNIITVNDLSQLSIMTLTFSPQPLLTACLLHQQNTIVSIVFVSKLMTVIFRYSDVAYFMNVWPT